jgi:hypothetical protein
MILTKEVGLRYQMDLIDMPVCDGYCYILRVIDHLSKYGFVRPLKRKSSKETAQALAEILCHSITPSILQMDNGGEVRFFTATFYH